MMEFQELYPGAETPVALALDWAKKAPVRVVVEYGDPQTGRTLGAKVEGFITHDAQKQPCVQVQARSVSAVALSTKFIVAVRCANRRLGDTVYEHPHYHAAPVLAVGPIAEKPLDGKTGEMTPPAAAASESAPVSEPA